MATLAPVSKALGCSPEGFVKPIMRWLAVEALMPKHPDLD
jgi:hypothetical protein